MASTGLGRTAWAADPVAAFPADVAVDWYDLLLHITKTTPGFSPPVASRAFAYVGVALYEAVRTGMPGYRSLAGRLPGLTAVPKAQKNIHWGLVANAVLSEMINKLYANMSAANRAEVNSLKLSYESAYEQAAGNTFEKSLQCGEDVAEHIFQWSRNDGGHEGYLNNFPVNYLPPAGEGYWVPSPPGNQRALQPFWGNNRSFTMPGNGAYDPGPHNPAFSSVVGSPFYNLALQVYDAVENPADPEWDTIARFWSDDPGATSTPPGHSISIASQVIVQEDVPLDFAVEVYLKLGIAVADAFISCWNTKYRYNLIRPVNYIRQYVDGAGSWLPTLGTPPFPEYTSGHSVQSGAMAEVMADLFGDDLSFVDHTHDDRGFAPRPFSSFTEAANEAAISRLYGGIHYLPAIELGVTQGRQVGAGVNALPLR